ncbi:MAG: hypothetical protein K2N18_01890, partial [Clostridia bacterium]|nr:hypothetical protein [Clostridia bacterium]
MQVTGSSTDCFATEKYSMNKASNRDTMYKNVSSDSAFKDKIWINKGIIDDAYMTQTDPTLDTGYTIENSPVRNPLIIRVSYYNYYKPTDTTESEVLIVSGGDDGDDPEGWFTVERDAPLQDMSAWEGLAPNHIFKGWTPDPTGNSEPITTATGILGYVKLYACYEIAPEIIDVKIKALNNVTNREYGQGSVTLMSDITISAVNGISKDNTGATYKWHKSGDTKNTVLSSTSSHVITNVKQSGKYTFDYVVYDKTEPLWRKSGTTDEFAATITPPALHPTALSTEQTAYVGAPYNKITPKATMQDPYGNTVTGTTVWQYNLATPIQPDDPSVDGYVEGKVWATFFFTPDESYDGNYGNGRVDPVDDDSKNIVYEFQFPISYLQIIFSLPELNEKLTADIIYDGDLSYRAVAAHFDTAFADYYAQNAAVFDKVLAGMTPTFEMGGDNTDGIRTPGATQKKINEYRIITGYAYEDVEASITIEVFFDPQNYSVTFKFADGVTPDKVESNKKYNEQLSEPTPPHNGQKLFTGWYYDVYDDEGNKTDEKRWDFDNRITGDLVLTAHWLDANDLDRIEIKNNTATYSATNPIQNGDLTVTAYFKGTLDGNTVEVPVVLTWAEYSNNIVYDPDANFNPGPNDFDGCLHVLLDTDGVTKIPYTVGVFYS